jgi:cell division protein ZapA
MAKLSIKVVVAGRTYPLTVEESEVDAIQNAADEINRRVKLLQENYAVKDMQDLLAMTALQLSASPKSVKSHSEQVDFSDAKAQLKELLNDISK